MALFRPAKSSGGGFLGFQEAVLTKVNDRTNETKDDGAKRFAWADLYLEVEFAVKGGQYPQRMQIAGSFDRGPSNEITGGSVLNKLYAFFDVIGFDGGVNLQGSWEDANGNPIENISDALSTYCNTNPLGYEDEDYNYIIYVYKEQPKKGQDKAYTRVANSISKNDATSKTKLEERINFLKSRNIIKEFNGVLKEPQAIDMSTTGKDAL